MQNRKNTDGNCVAELIDQWRLSPFIFPLIFCLVQKCCSLILGSLGTFKIKNLRKICLRDLYPAKWYLSVIFMIIILEIELGELSKKTSEIHQLSFLPKLIKYYSFNCNLMSVKLISKTREKEYWKNWFHAMLFRTIRWCDVFNVL